ncbi:MAG: hypothetical protein U9O24_07525 [Campylobacterota bacterium]|nr:hypothetical protein [Campylobacterota bacterium]
MIFEVNKDYKIDGSIKGIGIFIYIFVIFLELLVALPMVNAKFAYLVAMLYSIYFFYKHVYKYNNFLADSLNWTQVKGKIINKNIIWKMDPPKVKASGYIPEILYSYEFKNKKYKSKKLSLSDFLLVKKNVIIQHPKNQQV